MKQDAGILVITLIGLGILLTAAGCCFPVYVQDEPWAPDGHWGAYRYDYYPDPGVYYDRNRSLYFYHDGGNWHQSPSLPPNIHMNREHHRELHLDTDRPYTYHPDVNRRFPPGQR